MTSHNPSTYAREYLLRVYNAALEHGNCRLSPISEKASKAFTAAFYRLRRRSDSSNATFITPEMHLVTVTGWKPHNGGTLYIVYNKQPDELPAMPHILPGDGADEPAPLPPVSSAFVAEASLLASNTSTVPDEPTTEDINSYIDSLIDSARKRADDDD